ncbi:MAG: hypothetical protein ABII71_04780 [Candidatus Micrarchaeota archaeon]
MRDILLVLGITLILFFGCTGNGQSSQAPSLGVQTLSEPSILVLPRESTIPAGAVKITPETDMYPPILHSEDYFEPVPLSGPINSRGAEDSAFIRPDGSEMFFFFTPDPSIPAEKQLFDGATGIYSSKRVNGQWGEPQRIVLNNDISLEGCEFVQGNRMWFCSARAGNNREIDWYVADYENGEWKRWRLAQDLNELGAGELHITSDGQAVYFHAQMDGGRGGYDLYVSRKENGEWSEPENLEHLNSVETEGWPYVSEDGLELWFTRDYNGSPAIFRTRFENGRWAVPYLIVSQFAGEPTVDYEGNLYFTHHFFQNGQMLEADIYVAYKK